MRRRKVTYPPPKTATSGGSSASAVDARAAANANRAVSINLEAKVGRPSIVQGARVQIGSGWVMGEISIVEFVVWGVILPRSCARRLAAPAGFAPSISCSTGANRRAHRRVSRRR